MGNRIKGTKEVMIKDITKNSSVYETMKYIIDTLENNGKRLDVLERKIIERKARIAKSMADEGLTLDNVEDAAKRLIKMTVLVDDTEKFASEFIEVIQDEAKKADPSPQDFITKRFGQVK